MNWCGSCCSPHVWSVDPPPSVQRAATRSCSSRCCCCRRHSRQRRLNWRAAVLPTCCHGDCATAPAAALVEKWRINVEGSCLVPAELFLTRCQIRLSIATRDDLLVCPSCLHASRFEIDLRVVDGLIICTEGGILVNPRLIFYGPHLHLGKSSSSSSQ